MFFKNLAGTPATTEFSGTSFVTTLPAPIIAFGPIFTFDKIVELETINDLLPEYFIITLDKK